MRIRTAFLAILLIAGCSPATQNNTGFISGDGTTTVLADSDRGEAIELAGITLDQEQLNTNSYLGSIVVINVWASWCAPCRKEAPQLVDFNLKNSNVKMLGINTRDNEPAARAFEKYFKVEYPSLIDPDGSLQLAFRDSLPLSAIPTTVILDRSGRPSARILGETTRSLLESVIAEIEKD